MFSAIYNRVICWFYNIPSLNNNLVKYILFTLFTGFCNHIDLPNGNFGCDADTPIMIGRECSITCDEGYWTSVDFIECTGVDTWSQVPLCQGKQVYMPININMLTF